jgi:hypothetical protein
VSCEAQDNYGHGILVLGTNPSFVNCTSDQNGYLAVGQESYSSAAHNDLRVGSSAAGLRFIGTLYSYKTTVGADSLFTTQAAYHFNAYSSSQVDLWAVEVATAYYNASPNVPLAPLMRNGATYDKQVISSGRNSFWVDSTSILRRKLGAFPTSETDGTPIQVTVTQNLTNLSSVSHVINTTGKYEGLMVYSQSANRPVFATGSAANAAWVNADGTTYANPV